eukprot:3035264-Rhodomonas_salina.2
MLASYRILRGTIQGHASAVLRYSGSVFSTRDLDFGVKDMAMRKFVLLLAAACLLSAKETLAFTSSLALHGAARARLPLRTCRMSAGP